MGILEHTIDTAATAIMTQRRIIRFRSTVMIMVREPYEHFVPMDKETFERICYPLVGGMTKNRMNDIYAYLCGTAKDLTNNDRYILFGASTNCPSVWDMEALEMRPDISPDNCVWRSPYAAAHDNKPVPFILSLAGGNTRLYSDIMQSLAPLVMAKKPDGVIWWVGDSKDSKLTLIDALHRIFPGQLSGLAVQQLVGGRSNMLGLNSALGNIAEDSKGQVADTDIYKSIGAHQNFRVHRYHSQEDIEVQGNVHHIFSTATAPTFITKSLSVQWRTHVVPFSNRSRARILPDDLFGHLIAEMCRYANRIKQQGYRYEWSGAGTVSRQPEPVLSRSGSALPEFRW